MYVTDWCFFTPTPPPSSHRNVKIWSPTGRCVATLAHEAALTALQLSHLLLISATSSGTVQLWSLHSNSALMQWNVEAKAWLHSLAVAGSRVFGGGRLALHNCAPVLAIRTTEVDVISTLKLLHINAFSSVRLGTC